MTLPEGLPKEQPIVIELLQNNQKYTASFQIEDSKLSQEYTMVSRDRYGLLQESVSSHYAISGAVVDGAIIADIPAFSRFTKQFLARIILVGTLPGQFCSSQKTSYQRLGSSRGYY